MTTYRWQLLPVAPQDVLDALRDFPPLIAQLLYNRGIRDHAQAKEYLAAGTKLWFDPFLLPDMEFAVQRLQEALRRQEAVVVYGDFDADGITGTAVLVQGLRGLGINAQPYIPHRDREGYGLNIPALQALRAQGASLVISVDCGTSSVQEITHAGALGLDVVVVDHHAIPTQLPPAVAVVNPHRAESRYPFKGLSGVGVAFKLLQALYTVFGKPIGDLDEYLDLVAIGTVADLAPLREENRWMVQRGLETINQPRRMGLRALTQRAGLENGTLDASHLGYVIAPRLNAMGRLEHAMTSYQLLTTQDPEEATTLAEQLEVTNRERQRLTQELLERARAALEGAEGIDALVMVEGAEYAAGVVGLVASKLAEEWYRPAVVVERGPELSRGSARSIPGFSIVGALAQCRDLLVRYGGHPQAAGFTIETPRLPEFRERLAAVAAKEMQGLDLQPAVYIDAATELRRLPGQVLAALNQLGPFGSENPEPLFLTQNLQVLEVRTLGATGSHLELKVGEGGAAWRAVGFGMGTRLEEVGARVDIVYTLGVDRWQGQEMLQLRLRDLRPAGAQSAAGSPRSGEGRSAHSEGL